MLDDVSFVKNHSNFSKHLFKNTLVQNLDDMILLEPSDLERARLLIAMYSTPEMTKIMNSG